MLEIEKKARAWRVQFALSLWLEGLARFSAGLGGAVLSVWCIDAAVPLPLRLRLFLFWGGAAAASVAFYALFLRPLARLQVRQLLGAAARRHHSLRAHLLPAWELSRGPVEENARVSEALARAHVEQTESMLRGLSEVPIFPARLSPAARRFLAGVALCGVLTAPWLARRPAGLSRVLAPWKEVPLEELLEVSPGSRRVAWGTPVTIEVRWRSGRAESGLGLRLAQGGSGWARAPWDRLDGATAFYRLSDLTARVDYRLDWRDQRTRVYSLEPVPFPRLLDAKARIYLPGHERESASPDSEQSLEGASEISALRGSWIAISGRSEETLSKAAVRVSFLNVPVEMRRAPSGRYEAGFPLQEDGSFRLELAGEEGAGEPHPVSYGLKAVADKPPTADLLSPAFEVEASPRERLPITYQASDDLGLTRLELVSGGKSITLRTFARPVTDFIGDSLWDLSGLPLGAPIEFQIRATDNCAAGPQSTLSRKGVVRLVDFEAAHAETEQRWLGAQNGLDKLAALETAARETLKALARAASPEELAPLRKAWEASDGELQDQWREAARSLKELAGAMSKDPYSNPGMAEQVRALGEDAASAAAEDVPRASQAARSGNMSGAEERHARLEARARKAAKLLSSGKELQGLQDAWSQASRMDEAASELDGALSSMPKGSDGKPRASAEDKRKLAQALSNLQKQMEDLSKSIEALPQPEAGSEADKSRKVYTVPLNSARRQADALGKALAAGDYAEAARIAKRLSEELSKVRQSLADAARSAAGGGASGRQGGQDRLSKQLEEASSLYQEVIDAQSGSLSLAQKLDEDRTQALIDSQKKLLDALAVRQKAAVEEAAAASASGFPPEALGWMRSALAEFAAKEIAQAPQLLARAAMRLKAQGGFEAVAKEEQDILDALRNGASPPSADEGRASSAAPAAEAQRQASRKTGELHKRLDSIAEQAGALPGKAGETVGQAQDEQAGAEGALAKPDAPAALKHEEKALELLEQGMRDLSSAMSRQRRIESGGASPFDSPRGAIRRAGGGGMTGADVGFVPLPSAKDYQPPQELRRELEKSLQERRPRRYEPVIKDYFKRMSQ